MSQVHSSNPTKDYKNNNTRQKQSKRFYYSLLTFVFIIFILILGRSAIINIAKFTDLNFKYSKLNKIHKIAKVDNKRLKEELETYNSLKGAEEVARNNLKMTGKNEILIIIKD